MVTAEGCGERLYDYESDWRKYVFPESEAEFASAETIRKTFTRLDLANAGSQVGGIPIECDGRIAYVNDSDEHTIIFGESGSGKSYSLIKPLIAILAKSQSMFITDIKGELYGDAKIRACLEEDGCKCVCIDFREFDKDGCNLLQYPFDLYRSGKKDKAMAEVNSLISNLQGAFEQSKADPYWHLNAHEFLVSVIQLLFEVCASREEYHKYVNMLTLVSFCNERGTQALREIVEKHITVSNNTTEMLRSVLETPERTLSCIVSTVSSLLRDFIMQESLLKMLSTSTFDVRSLYTERTAVFLVLPDETKAYNSVASLLVNTFYGQLIDEFSSKYVSTPPPFGISWIMDEFCNMSIEDMGAKISASRSRMMRWYIVCQSKAQLEAAYGKEAVTIIGNCKNIFFLQSSDPEMLAYISRMLGTTNITYSGRPEPLMSEEKLKQLPRTPQYRQAIFIRGELKYKVNLPGFHRYTHLDRYASVPVSNPAVHRETPVAYTPWRLCDDLEKGRVSVPFQSDAGGEKVVKVSRSVLD